MKNIILALLFLCSASFAAKPLGASYLHLQQLSSTPQTPASGYDSLYFRTSDGTMAYVDSSGTVHTFGGTGTVTSVSGATDASSSGLISFSGTVTTAGSITESFIAQNANCLFAGPATGVAAAPTCRAMVNADIPTTLSPSMNGLTVLGLTASEPVVTSSAKGLSSGTVSSPLTFAAGAFGCQTASGTQAGCLSSADWSTFNGKQSALTIGNLTSGTTGVSVSGGTGAVIGSGASVSVQTATTSQPGLLSSADWNTFNGKASSGANSNITSMTGITGGIASPTYVDFPQQSSAPTTPGANHDRLYFRTSDGKPVYLDSTGTVNSFAGVTGPGTSTTASLSYFIDTTGGSLGSASQWGIYTTAGAAQGDITALSASPSLYLDSAQNSFITTSSSGASVTLQSQAANSSIHLHSNNIVDLNPGAAAQTLTVYQNFATQVGAGLGVGDVNVTTTPYTVNFKNGSIYGVNVASAATVNLPSNNGSIFGLLLIVKDESGAAATNHITITPNGADTIDGAASYVISTNYGAVTMYNNATTKWFIVSSH